MGGGLGGGLGGVPPPGTAAVPKHETGIPGTTAVSKHETKSVIQHEGTCSRGGFPPGMAAVSKDETGTVTKQTTGARGGRVRGGFPPPARLLCPSTRQVL